MSAVVAEMTRSPFCNREIIMLTLSVCACALVTSQIFVLICQKGAIGRPVRILTVHAYNCVDVEFPKTTVKQQLKGEK